MRITYPMFFFTKKEKEKIEEHLSKCSKCMTQLVRNNQKIIKSYQSREVAPDIMERGKAIIRNWGEEDGYRERQIWAAIDLVPVELCIQCPYFREGSPTIHQIGTCCYCRSEAKYYKMSGDALCANIRLKKHLHK